ncbi:MAG: metallophosphoesterase [Elusimicrobia bacterium]|nr:metallophosphoesterase [Elusimicrobiota bacterium]
MPLEAVLALALLAGIIPTRADAAPQSSLSSAPARGFRFAALSDSRGRFGGVNDPVLTLLADHIKADSGAKSVIFPGDMVSGGKIWPGKTRGQLDHWKEVMGPLYAAPAMEGLKVYPGLGNHEVWGKGGDKAFRAAFPGLPANGPEGAKGLAYSFDQGGIHFVMLDTTGSGEGGKPGAAGLPLDWLRSDLKTARQMGARRIFVFGHDPAFPVANHIKDSLPRVGGKDGPSSSAREGLKARDVFWDLLREFKVTAYVCGHEHLNSVESVGGVFQVVAGAAGAPLSRPNPCVDGEGRVAEADAGDFEEKRPYYDLMGYPRGKGGNCQASPDFWGGVFFGYALFEVAEDGVDLSFWGVEPKPGNKTELPEGASLRLMHSRRFR